MRLIAGVALVFWTLLWGFEAHGQIYTCTAPDGSRIFSDEKCGPDAKIVQGIETRRKSSTSKPKAPPVSPKSPEELERLLAACNAGDGAACMTWTKGGGPNQLKAQEKELEASCEAGSLPACEERYCRDGATAQCRERVMSVATVSGDSWYLRYQRKPDATSPTTYEVRCIPEGSRAIRDVTIACAAVAGPERCRAGQGAAFPRLDAAASSACAVTGTEIAAR